jgi:hypothetical protein
VDEQVFEDVLDEALVEEYFDEAFKLRETITGLEGRPKRPVRTAKFEKWLGSLDNDLWVGKVISKLVDIETYGRFGTGSHKCKSKNDIYEIVFDSLPLRVYFTVIDDKNIRLEDGSSSKEGNGKSNKNEQARTIRAIDKRISLRGY